MNGGMKLDIGCGMHKHGPDFVGVDKHELPGVDRVFDIEKKPWPIPSSSVSEIWARGILEHVHDLQTVMEECHRVLVDGGRITAIVPHWDTDVAHADPTHVRFFTEHTLDFFCLEDGSQWTQFEYYTSARFRRVKVSWSRLPFPLLWRKGQITVVLEAVK